MSGLTSQFYGLVIASVCVAWLGNVFYKGLRSHKLAGNFPQVYTLIGYPTLAIGFVRTIPWLVVGNNHFFELKHDLFKKFGKDVYFLSAVTPGSSLIVGDAGLAKHVLTHSRVNFPKPAAMYEPMNVFGENILAAGGEKWKMFRKVAAPAFSERNNRLVWDESTRVVQGLLDDVWAGQDSITVDSVKSITQPIALYVIAAAGFGKRVSWKDDESPAPGYEFHFKKALNIAAASMALRFIIPSWAARLTKGLARVDTAFKELDRFMKELVEEKVKNDSGKETEPSDLFGALISSNNEALAGAEGKNGQGMSDQELMGNIYVFLLAGHETAANTLCFSLGLLALYPDEQEKCFKEICAVLPQGQTPTYEVVPNLPRCLAVLYETLRLFPATSELPKISGMDQVVSYTDADGEIISVPLEKDTMVIISVAGIHYNDRYWEDPYAFKPDRFLDPNWPRDAHLAFAAGPRGCIGRRFFELEGLAVLSMLLRNYKITVKDEPKFAHETFEQRKERVLSTSQIMALNANRVPLVFTKRT